MNPKIIMYCMEETYFSDFDIFISFSSDIFTEVSITTYSTRANQTETKPATFSFSKPSDHLQFSFPTSNLEIKNIDFHFEMHGFYNYSEIIFIEARLFLCNSARFKDFNVNLENDTIPIVRIRNRVDIVNCTFSNFTVNNTFLFMEYSNNIKLRQSKIVNVQSKCFLISSNSSASLSNNAIENLSGGAFHFLQGEVIEFKNNLIKDLCGHFPLISANSFYVGFANNQVTYTKQKTCKAGGLLKVENFSVFEFLDSNVRGYVGPLPLITALNQETTKNGSFSMKNSTLIGNSLSFSDYKENMVGHLGLIDINIELEGSVGFYDCMFISNDISIPTYRASGWYRPIATIRIDASHSNFGFGNITFRNNIVHRQMHNIYLKGRNVTIFDSIMQGNTYTEKEIKFKGSLSNIPFQNFIFDVEEDIIIQSSVFEQNYGDFGGALSFLETQNTKIPKILQFRIVLLLIIKHKSGELFIQITHHPNCN